MKNIIAIHHTAKEFLDMWKRACDTAAQCIPEAKEYKSRGMTRHMWNQTSRKGTRWKNVVKVRLTEEFSTKHRVFPVSLVKPYFQTGEDKFPSRKKTTTPPEIVEGE
ncbi:hypothetical protein O181_087704 [Austropuccinia psidii MF-1]|uniref:Uncharacterized protein n=1 Tax=Austropuccinia psidii MF-1 TaxID=1389203 RepID=A0A9Q3IQA1_9BASI|nr:hypothetical protein [Austropuccinia psidii MF-1]